MALIEVNPEMSKLVFQLERIATALERLAPEPSLEPIISRPAELINVDPSAIAEAEEEAARREMAGT